MENKIKIFIGYLEYGSASCNRLFAYCHGFSELGYTAEIIAYNTVRIDNFKGEDGVTLRMLPPTKLKNKYLRIIFSYIYLLYFLLFHTNRKDKMMIYGGYDELPIFLLCRRSNIIHEITECPEIIGPYLLPLKFYFWCCKKIQGMFVISENLKQYFVNKGVETNNITVVNIIVDADRFKNNENTVISEHITYCGIISRQKDGVDILLESFAELHKQFPSVRLKLIGRFGPDWDAEFCKSFLETNNLSDFVEFTGLVSPDQMPKLLKEAKILVLSRPQNKQSYYGFPTKLGEYLMAKRPVVVTDVGNIRNFLSDKVSAFIVKPNDKRDLLIALSYALHNESDAENVARNGYDVANQSFNCQIECKKMINAFYCYETN